MRSLPASFVTVFLAASFSLSVAAEPSGPGASGPLSKKNKGFVFTIKDVDGKPRNYTPHFHYANYYALAKGRKTLQFYNKDRGMVGGNELVGTLVGDRTFVEPKPGGNSTVTLTIPAGTKVFGKCDKAGDSSNAPIGCMTFHFEAPEGRTIQMIDSGNTVRRDSSGQSSESSSADRSTEGR